MPDTHSLETALLAAEKRSDEWQQLAKDFNEVVVGIVNALHDVGDKGAASVISRATLPLTLRAMKLSAEVH